MDRVWQTALGNKRAFAALRAGPGINGIDAQEKLDREETKAAKEEAAAARHEAAAAVVAHPAAALGNAYLHALQVALAAAPYLDPRADLGELTGAVSRALAGTDWSVVMAAGQAPPQAVLVRPCLLWWGVVGWSAGCLLLSNWKREPQCLPTASTPLTRARLAWHPNHAVWAQEALRPFMRNDLPEGSADNLEGSVRRRLRPTAMDAALQASTSQARAP